MDGPPGFAEQGQGPAAGTHGPDDMQPAARVPLSADRAGLVLGAEGLSLREAEPPLGKGVISGAPLKKPLGSGLSRQAQTGKPPNNRPPSDTLHLNLIRGNISLLEVG